ncbi:glycosyltransferase family 2 protein [Alloalcanivorax xenomutans]|uniref:glycosyltransferase family 2 protein n=1 Tax=Alloalcanivorax xenomutans TaxID=1094342 RepID=UPI0009B6E3F1|nr:glycosyltransferase [Alloalcanivorax xenomutans]
MNTAITVIVPIFKHWHLMDVFFEKMEQQTLPKSLWELVIVDNGSPEVPLENDLPGFAKVLVCDKPGSYAARNVGIKCAKGELLVFTDADCQPDPDWLKVHWAEYKANGDQILNAGAVKVTKLTKGDPNEYELYDIFLGIPQKRYVTSRGYAVTANLGIPAEVFNKAGVFDDSRFSGGDAEYCKRANEKGFKLRYADAAVVLHPARSSWSELETKARRVKGGQIKNGSYTRRFGFFLKSFLYPLLAILKVLKSRISLSEKMRIIKVVIKLGVVEVLEVIGLLIGLKKPERR